MRLTIISKLWMVAALAVVAVCAALLGACGEQVLTTSSIYVTTAPPGSTTTSTSPAADTTIEEATTTTEAATTTTEALSSAETRLADGTIKGMGYIDKVWEQGGKRFLSIDYAELLTGDAATQAAIADGYIKPGEELDNDYYIRNTNPKKRVFTVSSSVVITTEEPESEGVDKNPTWKEFLSFWSSKPPAGTEPLHHLPWWIVRNGQEVISIAEQYLP